MIESEGMANEPEFVDHYSVLGLDPGCDREMVEKAFRHFAQKYHPDHSESADVDKFQECLQAYNVLKDAKKRAEYHNAHFSDHADGELPSFEFYPNGDASLDQQAAIDDAEINEKILLQLYVQRREQADKPGIIPFYIQERLGISEENFEFHAWYLKEKGFIEMNGQSELVITIAGVDHVISMSRKAEERKLLMARKKEDT